MKFRIFLKSFKSELIQLALKELKEQLEKSECSYTGTISLPMRIKKFCVLRSPHVDKDSREHFEIRLYKSFFDLTANSPSVLDLLLKAELPSGVSCSLKILETKKV
jgi:small subunit ribosomal protein S10